MKIWTITNDRLYWLNVIELFDEQRSVLKENHKNILSCIDAEDDDKVKEEISKYVLKIIDHTKTNIVKTYYHEIPLNSAVICDGKFIGVGLMNEYERELHIAYLEDPMFYAFENTGKFVFKELIAPNNFIEFEIVAKSRLDPKEDILAEYAPLK